MRNHWLVFISMMLFITTGCTDGIRESGHPVNVLDQPLPGTEPVAFAQDFLPPNNRDAAFTPDGKEFYFTRVIHDSFTIMFSQYQQGRWTVPAVASFSGEYNDFEPCISPDGRRFYFASMRPSELKEDMKNDIDIWVMNRESGGWGDPRLVNGNINTDCMEYYPSVTGNGTLYFGRNDSALTRGDIYLSRLSGDKYSSPEKLPEVVNLPATSFNAFISPEESYIIFSTYVEDNTHWHSDLYISFRDNEGKWMDPVNMGKQINSKGNDLSPWVSHDGACLFFASTRLDSTGENKQHQLFWVDASVIKRYRRDK